MIKSTKFKLAIILLTASIILPISTAFAEENTLITTQAFVVKIKLDALYSAGEDTKLKQTSDEVLLPRVIKALEDSKKAEIISHMTLTAANEQRAEAIHVDRTYTPFKKLVMDKEAKPYHIVEFKWVETETEFAAEQFYEDEIVHIEYNLHINHGTTSKDAEESDIITEITNAWEGHLAIAPGDIKIVAQTTNKGYATLLIMATDISG